MAAAILRRYPRATGTDGLTQEALNRRLPMAREALRLRFSSGAFTSSKDVSVALNITGESAQDLIDGALHKLGVLRDVGPDPGPPLDATEVRLAIRRRWPTAQGLDGVTHDAVMNLSPYSIEIVRMRFIGQMSAMDACVAIGLWHPDAVYRRESRALDQLGVRRYDVAMPVRRHVVPRMAHHKSQRSQPWT